MCFAKKRCHFSTPEVFSVNSLFSQTLHWYLLPQSICFSLVFPVYRGLGDFRVGQFCRYFRFFDKNHGFDTHPRGFLRNTTFLAFLTKAPLKSPPKNRKIPKRFDFSQKNVCVFRKNCYGGVRKLACKFGYFHDVLISPRRYCQKKWRFAPKPR